MKNSLRKIISLVLTVLMLVGTVTMLVPITASAADSYTEITKNTDFVHNGITYRFDVRDGNTDSYARIMADGSIEMKYSYGDILWFPEIKMTDTSAMHAEATAIAHDSDSSGMGNVFMGVVYGATEKADGSFNTGVAGILRTAGRARVTVISRENLTNKSSSDHGNGGGTRMYDKNDNFKANLNFASVMNNNGDWAFGTTVSFDVSRADKTATFAMSSSDGEFFTYSYDTSSYAYAGAVGWTSVWANNAGYKTFRFDKLTLTNCTVNGEAKDTYTVFDRNAGRPAGPSEVIYLEKNKTATIGGVTYRFDVANPDDETVWARINTDGTWEVSIRNGDMLWFPGVSATADSTIYTEFTNTMSGPINLSSGIAYGVKSDGEGYTTGSSAVIRTGKRIRVTPFSSNGLYGYNGSDGYGNGGDSPRYLDNKTLTENNAYKAIKDSGNENWGRKETVYFEISPTNGGVEVDIGAPSYGPFYNGTYNLSTYPAGDLVGSVGFVVSYQGGESTLTQIRYDNITITNCNVNGELKDTYTITPVFEKEPAVKNAQVSLSLDGTIGFNFAFNAANLTGATVVAKKNGVEVVNQPVVNGENLVTVPVNAKEMKDTINISIMVDGEVFDEHSYTTSVAEYAAELKELSEYAEWVELIDAMLNYGAAAQKLLNYKADEADVSGIVDHDFTAFEPVSFSGDKSILKGLHMNLSLESDTVLNLYFMPADGVNLTVTVNGEAAELTDNGDGYYVLSISGIAADKLADDFAIVVNGDLSFAVNALDWAKIASESAETETLANALAAYADAAARKN